MVGDPAYLATGKGAQRSPDALRRRRPLLDPPAAAERDLGTPAIVGDPPLDDRDPLAGGDQVDLITPQDEGDLPRGVLQAAVTDLLAGAVAGRDLPRRLEGIDRRFDRGDPGRLQVGDERGRRPAVGQLPLLPRSNSAVRPNARWRIACRAVAPPRTPAVRGASNRRRKTKIEGVGNPLSERTPFRVPCSSWTLEELPSDREPPDRAQRRRREVGRRPAGLRQRRARHRDPDRTARDRHRR